MSCNFRNSTILLIFLLNASLVHAQTFVSGTISTDTTWDTVGSPYIVTGDITVNPGITLTILPSVEVKFNGNYTLGTHPLGGTINAQGTAGNLITFTSNQASPTPGFWNKLALNGNSTIRYARVEYSTAGISTEGSNPNPVIDNNTIENNIVGISLANGTSASATNNTIRNNTRGVNVFLIFGSGNPNVTNNSIYNNSEYNVLTVSPGFGGDLSSNIYNFRNNWWGTTDPVAIMSKINDNSVSGGAATIDISTILDGPGGSVYPGQYKHGCLLDETWDPSNGTYYVIHNTTLNPGRTLTINPGTLVKFVGNYTLGTHIAGGAINAQGTAGNLITFTSNQASPTPGFWNKLALNGNSTIRYTRVEYSTAGISTEGSNPNPVIDNNTIENNITGITLTNGTTSSITNSNIRNNTKGVDVGLSNGVNIQNSIIENNETGIFLNSNASAFNISNSTVQNNTTGLYFTANVYAAVVDHNTIQNNTKGLQFEHVTSPNAIQNNVINNTIINNADGIYIACIFNYPCPAKFNTNSIYSNTNYNLYTITQVGSTSNGPALNAENNWWGTVDPAAISLKIYDKTDNPTSAIVDFAPFLYGPNGVPVITNISVSPVFFYPQGGVSSSINYTLNAATNVTIKIYNFNDNALVRDLILSTSQSPGAQSVLWDGRNNNNQILPPGAYYFLIDTLDSSGQIGGYSAPYVPYFAIPIQNGTVQPANFNPYLGETAQATYSLPTSAFIILRVGIPLGGTANRLLINNLPREAGVNSETWDGRDDAGNIVNANTYIVGGWTTSLPENAIVIRHNQNFVISTLTSDPYAFYPVYGGSTEIKYTISADAAVTIEIKLPSGTTVRSLQSNQNETAGQHALTWDGKDALGNVVIPGNYRVQVTAVEAASGTLRTREGSIVVFK